MIDRPLAPCPSCNRHVGAEPACPFCGATVASAPNMRPTLPGRFSRAAVFAGATLAGCWSNSPSTETTTTTTTATPSDAPAAGGRGRIEGHVYDPRNGPPGNVLVRLSPIKPTFEMKQYEALTNDDGLYVFADIPVGEYRISTNTSTGIVDRTITVGAGTQRMDLAAPVMHVHRHAPNMPYGAPPARRRIV